MKTLTNVAAPAPQMIHIKDRVVLVTMITQNEQTGLFSFLTVGNEMNGMDALLKAEATTTKIEPPIVETIAPMQTASVAPRRGRGRPRKNAETTVAPAPAAVETQVQTTDTKRGRGRPKGSKNNAAAAPASTPVATTTDKPKGKRNTGMQTDIFNLADFIGTLIHINPEKQSRTPVYIVSEGAKGCKVASPQKDQSGVATGFVKCAVWFSVNEKQEKKSNSLNIAKLFD